MAFCNVNGGSIYYEISGKGDPLVLIAGLASDVQSWLTVKKQLASRFQLILFDNRGVGRTSYTPQSVSIGQMTEDLVTLLDHLQLASVRILGHSMGGMIAMNLCLSHPERVSQCILAATTVKVNARNKMQFRDWSTYLKDQMDMELWYKNLFYWLYSDDFFEKPAMVTAFLVGALSYRYPIVYESFNEQVEAAINFDFTPHVANIKAPVLVLLAEKDRLFTLDESWTSLKEIPNATLRVVANTGHSLHIEQPQSFVKEVFNFFG